MTATARVLAFTQPAADASARAWERIAAPYRAVRRRYLHARHAFLVFPEQHPEAVAKVGAAGGIFALGSAALLAAGAVLGASLGMVAFGVALGVRLGMGW